MNGHQIQAGEETFASLLKRLKEGAGFSSEALAEAADLPSDTVDNWLKGKAQRPRNWRDLLKLANALHLSAADTDALMRATNHPSLYRLQLAHPDEPLLHGWLLATPDQPTSEPTLVAPAPLDPAPRSPLPLLDGFTTLAQWLTANGKRSFHHLGLLVALLLMVQPLIFLSLGYFAPVDQRFAWESDLLDCVMLALIGVLLPYVFAALPIVSHLNAQAQPRRDLLAGIALGYASVVGLLFFALAGVAALVQIGGSGFAEFIWQPGLRALWAVFLTAAALFGCFLGTEAGLRNQPAIDANPTLNRSSWFIAISVPLVNGPFVATFLYLFRDELRSAVLAPLLGVALSLPPCSRNAVRTNLRRH
jgi:transcriptional regulator with XRE-family HTH domain